MKKKTVVQSHHISYNPPIKVYLYKGEHWLLTQLGRRKHISKGFIQALKIWLTLHENEAIEVVE